MKNKITIKPKQLRTGMKDEELEKYLDQTRKSAHVARDKSKFNKKKERRKRYDRDNEFL